MKTFIKNLYDHLCTWSIIYIIGIYFTFSSLNLLHGWWKDPYSFAMVIIGLFFLSVILILEAFVRHWEINDSKKQ